MDTNEYERYAARLTGSWPRVRERIAAATERSGQNQEVTVVAVTKGHPAAAVAACRAAGLGRVGENRVQELASKVAELGRDAAEWHLIGHLQRNKVRDALPLFDLLHSVDSERLAAEVSKEAQRAGRAVRLLVQLNTSGEHAKGGLRGDGVVADIARIAALPGLAVQGLMTMAPLTDDTTVLRATFARLRELFDRCGREVEGFEARHLSMGMSNDFELAVEEGSTMVRLGTVLLGERTP